MTTRSANRGFLGPESEALSTNERHVGFTMIGSFLCANPRVQDRNRLRAEIDMNSFNWRVFAVAASGFFTDSYNLFATNVRYMLG